MHIHKIKKKKEYLMKSKFLLPSLPDTQFSFPEATTVASFLCIGITACDFLTLAFAHSLEILLLSV